MHYSSLFQYFLSMCYGPYSSRKFQNFLCTCTVLSYCMMNGLHLSEQTIVNLKTELFEIVRIHTTVFSCHSKLTVIFNTRDLSLCWRKQKASLNFPCAFRRIQRRFLLAFWPHHFPLRINKVVDDKCLVAKEKKLRSSESIVIMAVCWASTSLDKAFSVAYTYSSYNFNSIDVSLYTTHDIQRQLGARNPQIQ